MKLKQIFIYVTERAPCLYVVNRQLSFKWAIRAKAVESINAGLGNRSCSIVVVCKPDESGIALVEPRQIGNIRHVPRCDLTVYVSSLRIARQCIRGAA